MSLCAFGIHKWSYSALRDCWTCKHCARLKDWKGRVFQASGVAKERG